jgi:hypothetical protein
MFVQQRRSMTKSELKGEIESIIMDMVPGSEAKGPDPHMLSKASSVIDHVMAAVELYLSSK